MFVIGTAGHVDHGKSALVRALTGIDPDRLQEEKERGMTIDLGFAWLKLPSGNEVSIVDVPGHERFVRNMLAGVGGIDLALLVIAADEGVMPQTKEHLAILDLLQVRSGIVVIAKKDLVDEEWLELVTSEVQDTLKGTTLAQAPILAVSSVTGDGLPELISEIDRLLKLTPPRKDVGKPRLPIDRIFTIAGFGTVVTGTLIDGSLSTGQEVQILPAGLRSRIRGLQIHKHKTDTASPGSRVAANLTGLAIEELKRGDVVTTPGWLRPTTAVDVKLRLLSDLSGPLSHNTAVTFHTGSSEVIGKVRLLGKAEGSPGETTWAQIRLAQPVAVVKGDFFIIRSAKGTIGGGEIIDPHARRHRRFHTPTLEALAIMERGTPEEILLKALEIAEPIEFKTLVERSGLPSKEAKGVASALASQRRIVALGGKTIDSGLLFTRQGWERFIERVRQVLQTYHQQFSLRRGAPKEELKSRLKISSRAFADALQQLVEEGVIIEEGAVVRLPSHEARLDDRQRKAVDAFLESLGGTPYSPPSDLIPEADLLNLLIDQGKVVKASDNVVFTAAAFDSMVKQITQHIKAHDKITVAEVRDMFNTSRKYALALLEYLDEQKVTRRVGDERVLR